MQRRGDKRSEMKSQQHATGPLAPSNACMKASNPGRLQRVVPLADSQHSAAYSGAGCPMLFESSARSLVVGIFLPAVVLNIASGPDNKPWQVGPAASVVLAISIPLTYGVFLFLKSKQISVLALAGMGSTLLTGVITCLAWQSNGGVDQSIFPLLAAKEALLPIVLGFCVLLSHFSSAPLIRTIVFNSRLFDLARINEALAAQGTARECEAVLRTAAAVLAGAFFASGVILFVLTLYFLGAIDVSALNARELYSKALSKQMFWGAVATIVPFMIVVGGIIVWLRIRLERLTGLGKDELMTVR